MEIMENTDDEIVTIVHEDDDVVKFYRYETPFSYHIQHKDKLDLRTFRSIKETEQGHWICEENKYSIHIEINLSKKRWVHKTSRRRFAYPTKEEALNSFQHRKVSQLKILARQMNSARTSLKIANENSEKKFTLDDKFDIEEIRIGRLISTSNSNFRTTSKPPKSPIFKPNFNRDIFLTEEDMNL